MKFEFTALRIAQALNGVVEGDENAKIVRVSKIEEGREGSVTFLANPKYTPYIYTTNATAIVCSKTFVPDKPISSTLIRVDDPYSSFTKLLVFYQKEKESKNLKGISWRAKIHKKAKIGKNVYIGDFVSVGAHVEIGEGTKIYPNVTIYPYAKIGKNCLIHAGSIILNECEIGDNCILQPGSIVGSDGFGFAPLEDGTYMKIPQTGNVVLKENVEIGANATIDRATMGSTIIEHGTKIDNLIQIGHNCVIGNDCVIAGQSGVAGSTKMGSNCMIGGQTGIAGHLHIGSNVKCAAKSGISADIPDNAQVMGAPAFDGREYRRTFIHFRNLDKIVKEMNTLKKQVAELQAQLNNK
ncbi:MAG: UDP-3-O-(3-hydroxymyristoyl)glucosamine N-acyltransferase [Bacteroidales bacterium]|nr:UDP-3-O-(3-hydroxymyristoyl)glucosamine N-acyltransferase [Bacteroidales bacterium]